MNRFYPSLDRVRSSRPFRVILPEKLLRGSVFCVATTPAATIGGHLCRRIIVIGSGFGGLSAAARLAARGHQVELFEKRDKLGGRAYVYDIDGYRFDGGPTVITAPWIFR